MYTSRKTNDCKYGYVCSRMGSFLEVLLVPFLSVFYLHYLPWHIDSPGWVSSFSCSIIPVARAGQPSLPPIV